MAKVTTTFTKSVTGKVPYHFICCRCGRRCEKVMELAGKSAESYRGYANPTAYQKLALDERMTAAATKNLEQSIEQAKAGIAAYEAALKAPPEQKRKKGRDSTPTHLAFAVDGKCDYCGHEQFWSIDPEASSVGPGCVILGVGMLLSAVCLILSLGFDETVMQAVFMCLTLAFLAGTLLFYFLFRKKRIKQARARIAAMPKSGGVPVIHDRTEVEAHS
jgi:hypothetical protein